MYVMRIHAKFQSSNKYLFFNYFLFQGVLLEIVFRGMWRALAVRLDTDRGRYIPETHEWLTEDGGTGSGEQVEKRRKSRTESRENWMKSGVLSEQSLGCFQQIHFTKPRTPPPSHFLFLSDQALFSYPPPPHPSMDGWVQSLASTPAGLHY